MEVKKTQKPRGNDLGSYLSSLRSSTGFTLREVEAATDKGVSNAYLSQLEHGKIAKPSPNVLYKLSTVYSVNYEKLMDKAGYLSSSTQETNINKGTSSSKFSIENITEEEERELLKYLAFHRSKQE